MMNELTLDQKWDRLRATALSDHEPFCNYGQTNGREMCTCQTLVDIVEGNVDAPTLAPKSDRMAAARAARARNVAARKRAQ